MTRLDEATWRTREAAHAARVDTWTRPHLARAKRREKHPVEDFLFTYYPFSPGRLRRWSPGVGVVCEGRALEPRWVAVAGGSAVEAAPDRVRERAAWTVELADRTAARPARFGCSGLHEWAMVHRQDPSEVRHAQLPLRLGAEGTSAVVEALPLVCTHFDAFRFFTPTARPRNALQLTPEHRLTGEQGGCLHATMDLYSHAARLWPWVPSELVADGFELARRVRVLDMRASPYDVSSLGHAPVRVETPEGRQEYADAQRAFAAEGSVLRARLREAAAALVA